MTAAAAARRPQIALRRIAAVPLPSTCSALMLPLALSLLCAAGAGTAHAQAAGSGGTAAAAGAPGAAGGESAALDVERMAFDSGSIRQVMQARTPEVQACYERVLAETRSKPQGRVVLQFVIGLQGEVRAAKIVRRKTTLRDPRVHECVLAVRGWQFPRPDDEREHPIEYPFDLKVVR